MSPRFPQELFDYIIDYAEYQDDVLKTCSTVCKGWSIRSRSHFFRYLHICRPIDLDRWCKAVSPSLNGPSKFVQRLFIQPGVIPFVYEPQPLDPYLDHFSALTQVYELTMTGPHRGKLHLDMVFQCFSGFRDTLCYMELVSTSFGFEEMSRIVEFFPNLESLVLWPSSSPKHTAKGPFQPHRQASFPRLDYLSFHLFPQSPEPQNHLLSGFAEASMDLGEFSITGPIPDLRVVQKLLDSSAQTLTHLNISLYNLDLSACVNICHIVVHDLLHSYFWSHFFRDSFSKHQFAHTLSTIKSPTLRAISVPITSSLTSGEEKDEDEYVSLPQSDWRGLDTLLCDLLVRVRECARDPSWMFWMRFTGWPLYVDANPDKYLPDFQGMGGVVLFVTSPI